VIRDTDYVCFLDLTVGDLNLLLDLKVRDLDLELDLRREDMDMELNDEDLTTQVWHMHSAVALRSSLLQGRV